MELPINFTILINIKLLIPIYNTHQLRGSVASLNFGKENLILVTKTCLIHIYIKKNFWNIMIFKRK